MQALIPFLYQRPRGFDYGTITAIVKSRELWLCVLSVVWLWLMVGDGTCGGWITGDCK